MNTEDSELEEYAPCFNCGSEIGTCRAMCRADVLLFSRYICDSCWPAAEMEFTMLKEVYEDLLRLGVSIPHADGYMQHLLSADQCC